jgi:hypothetical protein
MTELVRIRDRRIVAELFIPIRTYVHRGPLVAAIVALLALGFAAGWMVGSR